MCLEKSHKEHIELLLPILYGIKWGYEKSLITFSHVENNPAGQLFRQALYLEAQNHMTAKNNERKKKYSSSVCGCEDQCLLCRSFSRCFFAKAFCSSSELHKSVSDVCTFVQNSLVATFSSLITQIWDMFRIEYYHDSLTISAVYMYTVHRMHKVCLVFVIIHYSLAEHNISFYDSPFVWLKFYFLHKIE